MRLVKGTNSSCSIVLRTSLFVSDDCLDHASCYINCIDDDNRIILRPLSNGMIGNEFINAGYIDVSMCKVKWK